MHGMKTALAFATALVGLTTLTGCAEEELEDFGTVRIEIAPVGGAPDIIPGTAEIVATVNYETCLQDFYIKRNPNQQQDGVEGAAVFEEWAERLCTDFDDIPDCEVTSIEQQLLEDNDVYSLRVTFKILDPSTIPLREVHVGPLPLESLAGCTGGDLPRVALPGSGLTGRDSNGTPIWRISSLPSPNSAVANQGAPLRVTVTKFNEDP